MSSEVIHEKEDTNHCAREVYELIPPSAIGEGLLLEKMREKGFEEKQVMKFVYELLRMGLIWCPVPHLYVRWEGSV